MSPAASRSEYIEGDMPSDHVHLVLVRHPPLFLRNALKIISSLYLKPQKYLAYRGWCVLGAEGWLMEGDGTTPLDLDSDLDDGGLYYYVTLAGTGLGLAVDLEVIKEWSTMPSESTDFRDYFRNNLLERTCCVFTRFPPFSGNGMHIIPYSRGSEWFWLIIESHPKYEEVGDMTDINDIRNGVFVNGSIHLTFDARHIVILKTPNHFLATTDIPQSNRPVELAEEVTYPHNMHYTLQWLVEPAPSNAYFTPNNIDAAFKRHTPKPTPSDLLLHYNYGAAAIKWSGNGKEVLKSHPNIPCPTAARILHDRTVAIQKRDEARRAREAGARSVLAGDRHGEIMDSKDDHARWDEDDVMLFFWGNSPAAVERRCKKEQEHSDYMDQWRQEVP